MLYDFIQNNRTSIITRSKSRVSERLQPKASDVELARGIPIFLDQLCLALKSLKKKHARFDHDEINKSSTTHGRDLFLLGFSIEHVVHDYGDVCQAVTSLAIEQGADIANEEFQEFNRCLDDAIASAVTEYSKQREQEIADTGTERLGILAHEMRNMLNVAMLTFDSIKSGKVAPGGSTAMVHNRSLMGLKNLIDRSLAEVRLDAGVEHLERISAAEFVEEIEIGITMQAQSRNIHFLVGDVDRKLMIHGDRQILVAAVSNLLQNALKFTPKHGHISLITRTTKDRVLFEVRDECGGLPDGNHNALFQPFVQKGKDLTGVGLGLSICRKAATANHGEINVHDHPGDGCTFTMNLPRLSG